MFKFIFTPGVKAGLILTQLRHLVYGRNKFPKRLTKLKLYPKPLGISWREGSVNGSEINELNNEK